MLHIDAARVKMERAVDSEPASFPPYDVFPPDPDWVPASGTLSLPIAASAEKGALIVDHCVASMISHFCGCFMVSSLRVVAVPCLRWFVRVPAISSRRRASRRPAHPALYFAHPQERGQQAPPKAQPPINAQAQVLRTSFNAVWREAAEAAHRRGKQTRSVHSQVSGQGERPRKRRSTVC